MITPSFSLTATERVLPRLLLDWTTGLAQPGVDVVRSGVATFVGSNGFIQSATANTQRVDWSTGTAGLLVEESRTNRILYSQDFSNIGWAKQNSSVSAAAGTSPDGTNNSYKLIEDTSTTTHQILTSPAVIVTAGTYCVSFYVKPAGRSIIRINDNSNPTNTQAFFSLSGDGSVTSETPAGTGSITLVGNGWYRCTMKTVTAQLTVTPLIRLVNTGTNTVYTGDGSSGVLLWGAQLEAGAFATSYIPTTTTAVTRNADVATMTGTNFSSWYNASQGTFTGQGALLPNSPSGILLCPNNGGVAERFRLLLGTTGGAWIVSAGGSTVAGIGVRTLSGKTTGSYKLNNFTVATNGADYATDGSGAVPTGLDRMVIGSETAGSPTFLNGWVQKIMYYPQQLTPNEIVAFSK